MSLFKTAAVLTAAIMMLPTEKGRQQQLYAQAANTVQDAATYCERNAESCAKAAEAWEQFKTKAAFAGELAFDALQRYQAHTAAAVEPEAEPQARMNPATSARFEKRQGTLHSRDLEPAWRGTIRRAGL